MSLRSMILRSECPKCSLCFVGSDDPLGFQRTIEEAVNKGTTEVKGKYPRCGWEGIIAQRNPNAIGSDYDIGRNDDMEPDCLY